MNVRRVFRRFVAVGLIRHGPPVELVGSRKPFGLGRAGQRRGAQMSLDSVEALLLYPFGHHFRLFAECDAGGRGERDRGTARQVDRAPYATGRATLRAVIFTGRYCFALFRVAGLGRAQFEVFHELILLDLRRYFNIRSYWSRFNAVT